VIYKLPAPCVLIETIIDMVVICCVSDAVGARTEGSCDSVLRPVGSLICNEHSLYRSRRLLQLSHHPEVLSTLSHIEERYVMVIVLGFVKPLRGVGQTILTLVSLLSNYCAIFLQ